MVWLIGAVIVTVTALVLGFFWKTAMDEYDPVSGLFAILLSGIVFIVLSGIVGAWVAPFVKAHL